MPERPLVSKPAPRYTLVAVRFCEPHAIAIQDCVFLERRRLQSLDFYR
jgi:hypothetical protein